MPYKYNCVTRPDVVHNVEFVVCFCPAWKYISSFGIETRWGLRPMWVVHPPLCYRNHTDSGTNIVSSTLSEKIRLCLFRVQSPQIFIGVRYVFRPTHKASIFSEKSILFQRSKVLPKDSSRHTHTHTILVYLAHEFALSSTVYWILCTRNTCNFMLYEAWKVPQQQGMPPTAPANAQTNQRHEICLKARWKFEQMATWTQHGFC